MPDQINQSNQPNPLNQNNAPQQNPSVDNVQAQVTPVQQAVPLSAPVNVALPKKQEAQKGGKTLILLLFLMFGFFVFAFVILFFLFQQTSDPASNPFIQLFGINPQDWIPFLINITSAGFGFAVFVSFIIAVIGIFKISLSKKEDKAAKLKGGIMSGIGAVLFVILIVIWMFVYLNLSSKRAAQTQVPQNDLILTDPRVTLDLVAPQTITFDASNIESKVSPSKYKILSYEWDFGDQSTHATGKKVSHLYTTKGKNGGRYSVSIIVTYKDLKTNAENKETFKKDIVFSSEKPNPQFTMNPSSGGAPLLVNFDASASTSGNGSITEYAWDLNEDGLYDDATGVSTKYTYQKIGTYKAKLRVTDSNGQIANLEQSIDVKAGDNPKAVISVDSSDGSFVSGKTYLFEATKSTSPSNAKIIKYLWDFGDGVTANTRTANHSYKIEGSYKVVLIVTDDNDLQGQDSLDMKITVPKTSPTAVITPVPSFADKDKTYIEGASPFTVSFNGANSIDPDNNIVDYKWDFNGDGIFDGTGASVSYVFKDAGDYNAMLTVIDADNNQSTASVIVKVKPHGLKAILLANPVQGSVPLNVSFDASASSFPEGKIISYEWDFGDGSPKRLDLAQISYKYNTIGTYTAKVKVTASDGSTAVANAVVSVRSVSLKSCFVMTPQIGQAPLSVSFDPSCSSGTVSRYHWDFGNGNTSRDRKPKTTYVNPGNYDVVLEVMDTNGVTNTVTQSIVVTGEVK